MSGGANNNDRFEQIGQSWLKHAFAALEDNDCSFGCNTSGCTTGSNLCSGCSDPYGSSLNASQTGIGSRAWVNPFTGSFPSSANNHSGHRHTGTSHRVTVAKSDLDPTQNPGATYFAEAQYVTPHDIRGARRIPANATCITTPPTVSLVLAEAQPISHFHLLVQRCGCSLPSWPGLARQSARSEPDPGNDGIWFMGYKVTNPSAGVWHYEYALYNENLDRGIQSFSVPLIARSEHQQYRFSCAAAGTRLAKRRHAKQPGL